MTSNAVRVSVASHVNFDSFARLLENMSLITADQVETKTSLKKRELEAYLQMWRERAATLAKQQQAPVESSFYPIMRLLIAGEDTRIYNLKETRLAQLLIKALCLGEMDATKLVNYNIAYDDLGDAVCDIMQKHCSVDEERTLSIEAVNALLDQICAAQSGIGGKEGQLELVRILCQLIKSISPMQFKWLVRILLKKLKVGMSAEHVLELYHPDAVEMYTMMSNLPKLCDTLHDVTRRYAVNEICVSLFDAVAPMLSARADPNDIERLLNKQPFYVETMFDGERFQLHRKRATNTFKYFSRNRNEFSDTFACTLTPFIRACFDAECDECILDGEMCVWDTRECVLLAKGEYDVKSNARPLPAHLQICYCAFDILLYNGKVLTNRPLRERLEYMRRAFSELPGRFIYSNVETCRTNAQVADALNKAIDMRLEGIVVKDPEAVYKPSKRNAGFYKIKPYYSSDLNDDLDLIVLGGSYSDGRRSGPLSHFLVGVAADDDDHDEDDDEARVDNVDDDELNFDGGDDEKPKTETKSAPQKKKLKRYPTRFYSLCRIGSGFTNKELYAFNEKLNEKWKPFDKKTPPKHLELGSVKPEFWIEPRDSVIVQVKAVQICDSSAYKTRCSLKFARLEKFRPDKDWHECMKLSELMELKEKNAGQLASGEHFQLESNKANGGGDGDEAEANENDGEPCAKKTRAEAKGNKRVAVDHKYRGIDASLVNKVSNALVGKEFCIIETGSANEKSTLERRVAELGGSLVQNPIEASTFCIVASTKTQKINGYIQKKSFDIVKVEWLNKCIEKKRFVDLTPCDMIFSKPDTEAAFAERYDCYGDSYYEETTIDELKRIFASMPTPVLSKEESRAQIALLEDEYFPNDSLFGMFRLERIYLDMYESINEPSDSLQPRPLKAISSRLELTAIKIEWYGGLIASFPDEQTTKCVLHKDDLSSPNLARLKQLNRTRRIKMHIVSSEWVDECVKAKRLLDPSPFHL